MEVVMLKGMLLGAIAIASSAVGLFFIRFWKVTHDPLFVFFALAFFLHTLSRVLMAFSAVSSDEHPLIYVIRLMAYGLIITGVVGKNLKKPL